jgi:iron uptake system EfeUOB component EfeO/EfeM
VARSKRHRTWLVTAATASLLVVAMCDAETAAAVETAPTSTVNVVSIRVDRSGCVPSQTRLAAGPTTFQIHVQDGNTVTEVEILQRPIVLAEIENVEATRAEHSFSLELPAGTLGLYCPGGASTRTALTVTGTPPGAASPASAAAVLRYRRWIEKQSQQLVDSTLGFTAALQSGNVARAKALYPIARVYYERVEPVAEGFSTLDKEIDARAGDVPVAQWTGFHPIERDLWANGTTHGTGALATKLVADVTAVNGVATRLALTPAQIANGAVELLNEVSRSKITGEEERYSHLDLVDFEANVEGSQAAFEALRPLLPARDAALGKTIAARFADVESALDRYRKGKGFVRYTALRPHDTRFLSQAVDALAEPLSQVGGLVVTSH